MTTENISSNEELQAIIQNLRTPSGKVSSAFIRQFFGRMPISELDPEQSEKYAALVENFHRFAQQRTRRQVSCRVYNPSQQTHGWESSHTVIELVNDDMPFLVDSVVLALSSLDVAVHLILHPVIRVQRDEGGHWLRLGESEDDGSINESMMHLQVDRQASPEALVKIEKQVRETLQDVRLAVEDWRPMRENALRIADELAESESGLAADEVQEARDFFQWLANDHFMFMGYREYEIIEPDAGEARILRAVEPSGLGLMRQDHRSSPDRPVAELTSQSRDQHSRIYPIIITKTNGRSTVHRDGYMDYISILRFDRQGRVIGEKRLIGLFTSGAYIRRCQDTPLVRTKVKQVLELSGLRPGSHAGKALLHILETLPRDELFQASSHDLLELSIGILDLQERVQTRLFVRRERFGRFYSCMVFIPRDRFNTENRQKVQHILKRALKGEKLDFAVQVGESKLARMHVVVRPRGGQTVAQESSVADIEGKIKHAIRSWSDELHEILIKGQGEEKALVLIKRFGDAFPVSYQGDVAPHVASFDVLAADSLTDVDDLKMSLYRPRKRSQGILRFKLFKYEQPIPLSDVLPTLENLGMRIVSERPYELQLKDGDRIWIQDFDMQPCMDGEVSLDLLRKNFQEAFEQTWRNRAENDGFNQLVLLASLTWQQAVVIRALAKYFLQADNPFSQRYMEETLADWPLAARLLVEYFEARFDPGRAQQNEGQKKAARRRLESSCQSLLEKFDDPVLTEFIDELYVARELAEPAHQADCARKSLLRLLNTISSADQDRILRNFADLIQAMLRTSAFQRDSRGRGKSYLSFKFDSNQVPDLPKPRPHREIWVYSPRVEGIHLRGGKVARGGLRWSDRREDFRTEVLGLMKAQTVKNTMIVPVGAKGGFFVKQLPDGGDRDQIMAEVVYCYRSFINGLLDITDNLVEDNTVPPSDVVRHDEDDPYLVVAADKGTATFSDIANAISLEHDFWLGDAFASGGSNGYDHKGMGITAKGAWESVRRHFRELGLNIQTDEFDVVGIGDMSGDVFGNGMLLSDKIRLKAAFNHQHIFIDPDPDAASSFKERKRLFDLPRSSWADYDADLISEGGGIFSRQSKTIPLSGPVREWLEVDEQELSPQALIRALLKSRFDLLWNGGIGTYVKSSEQSHADVDDLANNPVRVDANQLQCRVVGEGGNLGLTQQARIQFALDNGKINTDFIDNSAGVDCSDHEVNIKILLNQAVLAGRIDIEQRNQLLSEMTDEVEALVLRSNYLQTQAISQMESMTSIRLGAEAQFISMLERHGVIDRDLEGLPDEDDLRERVTRGLGLMRPEMAVLFSFSKIMLYQQLIGSAVPEDPYLARELEDYFPQPLRELCSDLMPQHRLKREIIATRVTNNLVNRMGAYFANRIQEDTGASPATVAKAFTVVREIFEARNYWHELETYDARISAQTQNRVYLEIWNLMRQATRRLIMLPGGFSIDISSRVEHFAPGLQQFRNHLPDILSPTALDALEQSVQRLIDEGIEADFARQLATFGWMYSAVDVVDEARNLNLSVIEVGRVYFRLFDELSLRWLRESVERLPVEKQWHAHARGHLRDQVFNDHRELTRRILTEQHSHELPVEAWLNTHHTQVERTRHMLEEMRTTSSLDFATMQVAVKGIGQLLKSTI